MNGGWQGIGAPTGTPDDISTSCTPRSTRHSMTPRSSALVDLARRYFKLALDFQGVIAADTEKWAKVVKFADIKAE